MEIRLGSTVPQHDNTRLILRCLSLAYEYNFNNNETMQSFDVGFGWSF